jgi:hypothetical protein
LVTFTIFFTLAEPTTTEPKLRLAGESVTAGAPGLSVKEAVVAPPL